MSEANNTKSSYQSIMKGTAIFGGTQVFNVLIGIVRGKLVAMILGPVGMGISSLLTSAIAPIQQFATLGMPLSAVRNISSEEDDLCRRKIVRAFRMMIIAAAFIGVIFTIALAQPLSKSSFGDDSYTWSFVALSLAVLFTVLYNGENTILQGYRRLKSLALRSIVGSTAGLLIGVPLYYIYGIDGIVPAIIILALVSYLVSLLGTRKIDLKTESLSWTEAFTISKGFMLLGLTMMVAVILGQTVTYGLNIIIRHFGTLADVGLFQAANSIVNQYVGMIFAAMATDYYPHLSSLVKDKDQTSILVHQQGEIVLFLVAPIAVLVIITAPLIIKILLTDEFYPVVDIIRLMGLGLIFKAACFPLGYLAIAKGDRAFYFGMDGIWTNIKWIVLFGSFYILWGFKGLGYAVLINSFIDIIVCTIMNKWRYGISYDRFFMAKLVSLYIITAMIMAFSYLQNPLISYILMITTGSALCYYCYRELDKRIDIKVLLQSKLHRK